MKFVIAAVLLVAAVTLAQGQVFVVPRQQAHSLRPNPFVPVTVPCVGAGCARQARGGGYVIRPESTLVLPIQQIHRTVVATPAVFATPTAAEAPEAAAPAEEKPECVNGAICAKYTDCAGRSEASPSHLCILSNGYTGVCCNAAQVQNVTLALSSRHRPQTRPYITVDMEGVRQTWESWRQLEGEMLQSQIYVRPNTKEFSHANFFGGTSSSLTEATNSFQAMIGFILYARSQRLSQQEIVDSNFDIRNTNLASFCGAAPTCQPNARYRNPDGTCNNLRRPSQGMAIGSFGRLLPAEYADRISEPKVAVDGGELPNPRLISLTISPDGDLESNKYSLLLMQFGQFVDHDLTRTAVTQTQSGGSITCCDEKVMTSPNQRLKHPACFQMAVPAQDNFLLSEQQSCIDFVRSAPSVNPRCRFGPREQMNQLSAYIDGNNIYGASKKDADGLREFRAGRLKVSKIHGEDFLPQNANDTGCQLSKDSQRKCFIAGDGRVNEVLDLSVVHNVWMREHNRVARVLSQLNPRWNDETLYQEAKRIVVAEFQHVIYNEFLPLILGQRAYAHFNLGLSRGYSNTYNPAIDATILNEFATAAYRLHSLVAGTLNLQTPSDRLAGRVLLRDQFNNPGLMYERGGYEMRLSSLTGQAIQVFDNFFTRELTNHLFQIPGKRFGLDLVALNIQRGRDHGIPGYIKYRDLCGLSPVRSFDDLRRIFSNPQVPDVMAQLYRNIEDVDLFIAGTSEKRMPGAVVGPTFACIIGEQFKRVKEGDRFWYENPNQAGSFTPRQLAEIKQTSMARIICDNSNLDEMQPNAFLTVGRNNPKLSCQGRDIPYVNLEAWANYRV